MKWPLFSSQRSFYQPGPSFGGVREGRTTPPPLPPPDNKAENLPQQHPPESTILHQFAAKNKKNLRGGMPPDPTTCVPHSLNAKYQFRQYFTGSPINLCGKYPSNPKFDPTFKNFWARACQHIIRSSEKNVYLF